MQSSTRFAHHTVLVLFSLVPGIFLHPAIAQSSHPEVLVVYNTNFPDSLSVASHYLARRNVPSSNLCAITPPKPDALSLDEYNATVKAPIRSCLNSAGPGKSLYIVMSYLTPFVVYTGPTGKASIDSYLADIWDQYVSQPFTIVPNSTQPYYTDSQSQGNAYQPFVPFAAYRASPGAMTIYSVWRLDAPTAALASALVDQAIQAEANGGPAGQACIDRRYGDVSLQADSGYTTGDWDLRRAASFLQQAGIPVMEDANNNEFGTAPAPAACTNTAFYSGWYSLNHYNDAFTWRTGSIGWHLDSLSVANPRTGSSWGLGALQRGIAVTTGAVSEPYLEGMVRPGGAFRNLLEGASIGDAFLRNTRWLKWMILYVGDPLYRPFAVGRAPFQPLQAVDSLQIAPRELVGGKSSAGTIKLSAPAPAGGLTFLLSTTAGAPVGLPQSVTVAGGATQGGFSISTTPVIASRASVLTAAAPGLTLRNTIVADPLLGALVPSAVKTSAGLPVSVKVILNDRAPAGGAVVALSSDNSAVASVPSAVTVPANATTAAFNVTTVPVAANASAKIKAKLAGADEEFTLSIVPAIAKVSVVSATLAAGKSTELEVYLATPAPAAGATVELTNSDNASLSVPASLRVAPGSTYGHTVITAKAGASGKTVTITARYGGAGASVAVTIPGGATASLVRINSGGPAYTDPSGQIWSADSNFSGGAVCRITSPIANTTTPALYQTCRYGAFQYTLPVANGSHTVKLKFAEVSMNAPGQRAFHVDVNGSRVLTNFDIFAQARGARIALDKSFPVTVTNGQVLIRFYSGSAGQPLVSAVEIQ